MRPLHSLERKFLEFISRASTSSLEDVASKTGMGLDQTRRALEWLKTKKLVATKLSSHTQIFLGPEGKRAASRGLPERRLVGLIQKKGEDLRMSELNRSLDSTKDEFSAAIGYARKKGWIITEKGSVKLKHPPKGSGEERLLKSLSSDSRSPLEMTEGERKAVSDLVERPGYLIQKSVKTIEVRATQAGKRAVKSIKSTREIDSLTPELLATRGWKKHKLRALDVEAPPPTLSPGKKHPVQRFIDEVREIFVSLGFEEIEGPIIQPSFWNFDALFTPQDHPARDIQDTFYLPSLLAKDVGHTGIVKAVAGVHQDGGSTGSTGWGYKWRIENARHVVLRTHTTSVTVKYLADHRDPEGRVFSVGRVFRNEKVTFKNLVEFYQIEGIVSGKTVNLRDMMGLLTTFYHKLGLKKVKFWPSYFPYTEPSLQSMVFNEDLGKWVELCGMGIFRPEVTQPLGVTNPVLAWGGGLERLVMLRHGVHDVRELYENDLRWLRRVALYQ